MCTRTHVKKYPYLSKCNYKNTVATCMYVHTYVWNMTHGHQSLGAVVYLFTSRHVQIGHLLAPLPNKEVVQPSTSEVGAKAYAEVPQVCAVPVWDRIEEAKAVIYAQQAKHMAAVGHWTSTTPTNTHLTAVQCVLHHTYVVYTSHGVLPLPC